MDAAQSGLSELFDSQSEAMRTKDLDRLMSLYSSDVVYFDVVPPLQFAGSAALRARFQGWFDGFEGAPEVEARDRSVSVVGDAAVAHWFSRVSGTLENGRRVGSWVRVNSCCRRSGDQWLVTHEHISLPVDPASGMAAVDLQP